MGLEIETVLEVLIFGKETLKLSLEFLLVPEGEFVELLHLFVGICQSGAVLLENFGFSLVLCIVEMLEFLVQLVNLLAQLPFSLLLFFHCPLQFLHLRPLRIFGQNLSQFGQVAAAH